MDFGKLPHIEDVDFSLPAAHPGVNKVLGGERSGTLKVYVGAPVWADPGYIGSLYPASVKTSSYLKYYARQFNCIELNATHYKIPEASTVQKWKKAVNDSFKFCPKVPQTISHSIRLEETIPEMNYFIESVSGLGENLGTLFLQLPPTFSAKGKDTLMHFLDYINPVHLSVELRHPDWFAQPDDLRELSNFLYKKKMGLVITDVAGRRDILHMRLTNKTAMVRFQAHDLHPTDYQRLDEWIVRCTEWIDNGLETLYFFLHLHDKTHTVPLAEYFIKKLNPYLHKKLNAPVSQNRDFKEELF
jgi:uncharacterized protein YecE (DUF72 family)